LPLWNRDYIRGEHPSTCTCVDCVNARLAKLGRSRKNNISFGKIFNRNKDLATNVSQPKREDEMLKRKDNFKIRNWIVSLVLIFALSIVGFGTSLYINNFIPFWMMFGFSVLFSLEKWFKNLFKNKVIGKLYRLILNFSILFIFGFLIYSGIKLFLHKIVYSPLIGSIVFIFEIVFFVYLWKVVARNSWRWPSMKLTLFSSILLFLVLTFAGVQPMTFYKDKVFDYLGSQVNSTNSGVADTTITTNATIAATLPETPMMLTEEVTIKEKEKSTLSNISEQELRDNPKLLGITEDKKVEDSKAVILPTIPTPVPIIIPKVTLPTPTPTKPIQSNLRDPSWTELKAFLLSDKTDEIKYVYPTFVCDNFASTLQSNAKKAGWRCAKVEVRLSGYPDWYKLGIPSNTGHACNAFETTDRGLVYIDDTGPIDNMFPSNCDKIVDVKVGGKYIPQSIFPSIFGWHWVSCGTVVDIETIQW
jgi:hypothetical protein